MLSLAHLTFMHADPIELIALAEDGGFDAVGLRLIDPAPGATFFPVVGDTALRRQTKAALKAAGLALLDIEAVWLWPQTEVHKLRPALEVGAELGARNLLVAGNDPDRRRMTDRLAEICQMADEYGMEVGFEFIPYTALNSLAYSLDILRDACQPNAGLLIDALHLNRSNGSPSDITAIDPALIAYGHLCDAPAVSPGADSLRTEARSSRLFPGDGGLPLTEFLRALPANKPVAMEAPSMAYGDNDTEKARRAGAACRALLASIGRG
jgi:sugar phosphate isomerase/epimerase